MRLLLLVIMLAAASGARAQTTLNTMSVHDGGGTPRNLRVDQNGDGSYATHNVPEVGGVAVGSSNPEPVNDTAGNASLAAIATNTTGAATASNQASGNGSLAAIATNTGVAATAAKQDTGNTAIANVVTNTASAAAAAGAPTDGAWTGTGGGSLVALLKAIANKGGGSPYSYTPLGCQSLTVTSGSAVALSTVSGGIPTGATLVDVTPTGNSVNYHDDGTSPTSGAGGGVQWSASGMYPYSGALSAIKFISLSGTSVLGVCFYR